MTATRMAVSASGTSHFEGGHSEVMGFQGGRLRLASCVGLVSSFAFVVSVTSAGAAWAAGLPTTTSTTICVSGCRSTTTTTSAPVRDTTTTTVTSTTAKPATTTTTAKPPSSGSGSNNASTGAAPSGSSASNSGGLAELGGGQATNSSGAAPALAPASAAAVVVASPFASLAPAQGIAPGPRSTVELMSLLSGLRLSLEAKARLIAPFPVAGPASYGGPTATGGSPLLPDQGTDIAAAGGVPVVASGSGIVAAGGGTVTITLVDGTVYSYAGLGQLAVTDGSRVAQGDVLGLTSDAAGPHLRFAIRPQGGATLDATPFLDRWLAQAMSTVRAMGASPTKFMDSALGTIGGSSPAEHRIAAANAARKLPRSAEKRSPVNLLVLSSAAIWWAVRRFRSRRALAAEPVGSIPWVELPERSRMSPRRGGARKATPNNP